MKKIYFLLLVCVIVSCSKSSKKEEESTLIPIGYNHNTPEGKLLEKVATGSNKQLKEAVFTYYNGSVVVLEQPQIIHEEIWLLLKDNLTLNPDYAAVAEVSDKQNIGPIVNKGLLEIHIENGKNYFYYQSDIHQTVASQPSTVQKVEFTISNDFTNLELTFTDVKNGEVESDTGEFIAYTKRIRKYKYVGLGFN